MHISVATGVTMLSARCAWKDMTHRRPYSVRPEKGAKGHIAWEKTHAAPWHVAPEGCEALQHVARERRDIIV